MRTSINNNCKKKKGVDINALDFIGRNFNYFSSIVMQVIRTEAIMNNVKLCFLILSCIAEDQYANSLMHDANLAFRVQLHRVPMHHRKIQDKAAPAQPLAATLLGIIITCSI